MHKTGVLIERLADGDYEYRSAAESFPEYGQPIPGVSARRQVATVVQLTGELMTADLSSVQDDSGS